MIEFEDFAKVEMKIGEIVSTEGGTAEINCGNKTLSTSAKIEAKKGDKIVVGVTEDKVFPLAASTSDKKTVSLITPDTEIAPGSTVG